MQKKVMWTEKAGNREEVWCWLSQGLEVDLR